MGCFLACFGFKKKKKRRKSSKKSPSGEHNNGSYVPLDSDASIKEIHFISESHQQKEKPKKKVSFNLNVKAYEPIPKEKDNGMYLSDDEDDTKWEFNSETKNMASLHYEEDTISSSITTHSANHRYQNCRDSYDELKLDEDDLDFDDSDEEVDDLCSKESDDDDGVITNKVPDERNACLDDNLDDLQRLRGRDRSKYVLSVLNPVENLTQWKVVKAKAAKVQYKCQKENSDSLDFKKMRNCNVAVDASLSNWLGNL